MDTTRTGMSGSRIVLLFLAMALVTTGCASEPAAQDAATHSDADSAAEAVDEHGDDESDGAGSGDEEHDDAEHEDAEHEDAEHEDAEHEDQVDASEATMLTLPELTAADLNGAPLRVVASTSIIGDVVSRVGGEAIDLTVLMGPGQDPHGYEPAARDLTDVARAQVIFVNGWDLEENLVEDLAAIGESAPVVPISANIEPRAFGQDAEGLEEGEAHEDGEDHEAEGEDGDHEEGDEHDHHQGGTDPHVWFSVPNVAQWVANVQRTLSDLDPANAELYEANAVAYLEELLALEHYAAEQLGQVPQAKRLLVTNHDAFGYLAEDHGMTVLGTIIPSMSTLAEPSASDLAELITAMNENGVCAIFTETSVSDTLAQTVAAELSACDDLRVRKLYTGALGPEGSGADSYVGMYRANVDAIVSGLQ